jgi:hypothetical protein
MENLKISKNQKLILTIIAILSVISVAGLAMMASVANERTRSVFSSTASVVNLRGETVCVNQADKNKNCVFGIKTSEKVRYVLMDARGRQNLSIAKGEVVYVTGTLSPPSDNLSYETAGIINVEEIISQ